jgi:hypothetical protein
MTVEVFLNSRDRSVSEAAALEAALRGQPLFPLETDGSYGDWV